MGINVGKARILKDYKLTIKMRRLLFSYMNTFADLSKEVWWLAFITLINRAGTMVVPFLSLYLTKSLGFTLSDVGWVMSYFGLGSVVGSWLGGKLTDKIGFYKVMILSLGASGVFLSSFSLSPPLLGFAWAYLF